MTTNNLHEALLPYYDMLADISFVSESEYVKRHNGHFVGQIGYGANRSIGIEYPMDVDKRTCNCGGMGTPILEVTISPVTDKDVEDWKAEAHRHVEVCRECDKWQWAHIDHTEYRQGDDDYEKAMRYIDDMCDSRNRSIDNIVRYGGEPITINLIEQIVKS